MSEPREWKFLVLNRKQSLEVGVYQRITVGRDGSNDLVLQDDEVSRSHAIIYLVEDGEHAGKLAIKDLNSLNGLFLNGKKLREGMLNAGDELIIGGTILLLSPDAERDIDECLSSKGRQILRRIGSPKPFVPATVESLTVESLAAMAVEMLQDGTTSGFWSRFDSRAMILRLVELSRIRSEQEFFKKLLQVALQLTKADRGVIMMADPKDQALAIRALSTDQEDQTIFISQSIIRSVMKSGKALYSTNVPQDERFGDLASKQSKQPPSSLIAMPLEGAERPQGFLYLECFQGEKALDQNCLLMMALLLQPVAQFPLLRAGQ